MVVENQGQVVLGQQQVTYDNQNQFILQSDGNIEYRDSNTQQVYYVEQVDTMRPELKAPTQPVVLNHHLQSSATFRGPITANAQKLITPMHRPVANQVIQHTQIKVCTIFIPVKTKCYEYIFCLLHQIVG